ncbi:type IV pilus assembly protein FimV [Undibacterium sp. Ji50W]|uniref:type IV pilus assembly protein FimV n=1 Tax=Undibacterium sp. Ji50W TaxID=3413041 RepID=UPI003BF13A2E
MGQPLRAQLEVTGRDAPEIDQSCFKAKVETTDGVFLAQAGVTLLTRGNVRYLTLVTRKELMEPAVKIMVDMGCEIQLHREFLILLDPPLSALQPVPSQKAPTAINLPQVAATNVPVDTVAAPRPVRPKVRKEKPQPEMSEGMRPDTEVVPVKKSPKKSSAPPLPKNDRPPRDQLKLSDDVVIIEPGLRLSDKLTVNSPQSNIEELRAAQAQFAAMLRDEVPVEVAPSKLKSEQQKILSLQQEAQQLKRQSQLDKAALEETRENSFPREWIIGLSIFALAGLSIIAFLLLYISRMHKRFTATWWQQKEHAHEPEPRKNIEEIVDSIQASYGPTTTGSMYQIDDDDAADTGRQVTVPAKKNAPDSSLGELETPSIFSKAYVPTLEDSNSSTFNFFSTRGQSVKVEEISDVTQEAEFWISVNDPQRAIEILEPQAEIDLPESPVPWLYLLDLYRVTGNKEKYDILRDRFVVFFNANIPEYETDPALVPVRQLEDFEHLTNRICRLWGSNDILPFLESLLVDDRDGKRMGFELPVYRDILLLISVANELERMGPAGGKPKVWTRAAVEPVAAKGPEADSNIINFETIDFRTDKEN